MEGFSGLLTNARLAQNDGYQKSFAGEGRAFGYSQLSVHRNFG